MEQILSSFEQLGHFVGVEVSCAQAHRGGIAANVSAGNDSAPGWGLGKIEDAV